MTNRFSYFQGRMQHAPDIGQAGNEWDIVKELIQESPADLKEILAWILEKHVGYVEPRVMAGEKLHKLDENLFWQVIEKLIASKDPDDRDVAIMLLEKIKDTTKYSLALSALDDQFAYLALEAAEIFWPIYPAQVQSAISKYLTDENKNIRDHVQKLLDSISLIHKE